MQCNGTISTTDQADDLLEEEGGRRGIAVGEEQRRRRVALVGAAQLGGHVGVAPFRSHLPLQVAALTPFDEDDPKKICKHHATQK